MIWLKTLPPAICYFLFNWQFFRCVESILKIKPLSRYKIIQTFLLNYSIFFLSTLLGFHLIVNWIIFLFLLLAEQLLLYKQSARNCALFALLGTQLGLAVNILCRSLIAIILNVPLVAFDNRVLDSRNMKVVPVLLGFLFVGLLFYIIIRFNILKRLILVLEDPKTSAFFLALLIAMYFYLCLNLMVYSIKDNNLILKLWSMKSAIFVIVGQHLSVILSIHLGQISVYRKKSQESQEQLAKEQLRELELRAIASTDPLTNCENRLQAKPRIQEALDAKREFCLGFVDLNRLKFVNDSFGHDMGDRYILAVSKVLGQMCRQGDSLFRYGGDEFLLLLFDTTVFEANKRLRQAQKQLEEECIRHAYPFSAGISYGIATPDDGIEALTLVKAADSRMYHMKQLKYQ